MIRVLGGQKNPRQAWERLVESHPEVVPKCDNLRFPGRGQRETPIARTKEDAYYILLSVPMDWTPGDGLHGQQGGGWGIDLPYFFGIYAHEIPPNRQADISAAL